MKRWIAILSVVTFLLVGCSCQSNSNTSTKNIVSSSSVQIEEKQEPSFQRLPSEPVNEQETELIESEPPKGSSKESAGNDSIKEIVREIISMENFSCERAWVRYTENSEEYRALIDPEGNIIARFLEGTGFPLPFANGYSHILTQDQIVHIMDKSGAITFSYGLDESVSDVCTVLQNNYGLRILMERGGCVITQENVSGFDDVGYQYTIYGPTGEILDQFSWPTEILKVEYCGQGIFRFWDYGYYCTNGDQWIPDYQTMVSLSKTPFLSEKGDAFVIGYHVEGDDGLLIDGHEIEFLTLNANGEGEWILFDFSQYEINRLLAISEIVDDICLLLLELDNGSNTYVSINMKTQEIFELSENLAEKISFGGANTPGNGRIIIPFKGDDSYPYVGVFDEELNLIYGPFVNFALNLTYSNDRIVIAPEEQAGYAVYDTNGDMVFSLAELGYKSYGTFSSESNQYSNGVLLAYDEDGQPVYLDVDGNVIEIQFDDAATIKIPVAKE